MFVTRNGRTDFIPRERQISRRSQGAAMSEWKASVGRVVLFPTPLSSPRISAIELYRRLWGGEPDSFQRQANPLMPTVAQGQSGGLTVGCFVQPGRIDLNLSPPSSQEPRVSFPLIEDMGQFDAQLLRIIEVVGQGAVSGPVVRVALNLQFLALNTGFAEANRALTAIIPNQYGVKIANEEDFIFQVNRPYISREAGDIKVNCITKWSVDRLQILTIALGMGGAPTPANVASPKPQTAEFTAASIAFDINNVPAETMLSAAQQSSLLHEALTAAAQTRHDIGLNVEGLQNANPSR
jgi:hypothetical protein